MRFPAVEPTDDGFAHERRLGWVSGSRHPLGERGEVFPTQLALCIQTVGEVNHFRLLLGWQFLDLLNYLRGCHTETLTQSGAKLKPNFRRIRPNLLPRNHDARQTTKCAVKSQARLREHLPKGVEGGNFAVKPGDAVRRSPQSTNQELGFHGMEPQIAVNSPGTQTW